MSISSLFFSITCLNWKLPLDHPKLIDTGKYWLNVHWSHWCFPEVTLHPRGSLEVTGANCSPGGQHAGLAFAPSTQICATNQSQTLWRGISFTLYDEDDAWTWWFCRRNWSGSGWTDFCSRIIFGSRKCIRPSHILLCIISNGLLHSLLNAMFPFAVVQAMLLRACHSSTHGHHKSWNHLKRNR